MNKFFWIIITTLIFSAPLVSLAQISTHKSDLPKGVEEPVVIPDGSVRIEDIKPGMKPKPQSLDAPPLFSPAPVARPTVKPKVAPSTIPPVAQKKPPPPPPPVVQKKPPVPKVSLPVAPKLVAQVPAPPVVQVQATSRPITLPAPAAPKPAVAQKQPAATPQPAAQLPTCIPPPPAQVAPVTIPKVSQPAIPAPAQPTPVTQPIVKSIPATTIPQPATQATAQPTPTTPTVSQPIAQPAIQPAAKPPPTTPYAPQPFEPVPTKPVALKPQPSPRPAAPKAATPKARVTFDKNCKSDLPGVCEEVTLPAGAVRIEDIRSGTTPKAEKPPEAVAPAPPPAPAPIIQPSTQTGKHKSDLPAGWDQPAQIPEGAVRLEDVKTGERPQASPPTTPPISQEFVNPPKSDKGNIKEKEVGDEEGAPKAKTKTQQRWQGGT